MINRNGIRIIAKLPVEEWEAWFYRCARKAQYHTKQLADIDAAKLAGKDGAHMSSYYCQSCHFWHVGHTPKALRYNERNHS